MPQPSKPNMSSEQNPRLNRDADDEEVPSNILWLGNLSPDVSDSDLMTCFGKFGALDSITTFSSRCFAFIYFKALDDAKAAKEAVQGTVIHGSPIKIEFARPPKPGKHIWVGAVSPSITREQLEDEFKKFGKLEEFRFFRERNSAIIHYYRIEDAVVAVKNMNGKIVGGDQMRVDFLRSQPSKRDNWSESRDSREGGQHINRKNNCPPNSTWRHSSAQSVGARRGEAGRSNILWIGYPPSVQIDEQMLHNAMILFGEIERIKSFPSRHYSFVEFRSIEEARCAKEGLQGRLFNDPRIQILFSSSDFAPGKDSSPFFSGVGTPRPDMYFNESTLGSGSLDMFGHPHPVGSNGFPGAPSNGMHGPNIVMRPCAQGFDLHHGGQESLNDFNNPAGPSWRRVPSPTPGMLPPTPGMRPSVRPMWDGYDGNPFQRDAKRSRVDGSSGMDNQGVEMYGPGNVQVHRSPLLTRPQSMDHPVASEQPGVSEMDYIWRGIIAKGGSPVCNARCIPIGKRIDSQLPEVVNCSARTGLDMLAKHYAEANGFDIVYFLPDCEEDFASYTEFLRYLGMKNRAGVAKFDDGTTLFLVPPSDFLSKVLNVVGPERLYGVVLKLPQQQPQHPIPQLPPQYIDRPPLPPTSQIEYGFVSQKEDHQVSQMDYNRFLHEDPMSRAGAKPLLASGEEGRPSRPGSSDYAAGNPGLTPPAGVSLTPELIATLAALLPANAQSPSSTGGQVSLSSSLRTGPSHGWRQEEQTSHPLQQFGHQIIGQAPQISHPTYAGTVNGVEHPTQAILGGPQVQDPSQNVQQSAGFSVRPTNSFVAPPQGTQYAVPSHASQQYQIDPSQNSQLVEVAGLFRSPVPQQLKPITSSTANMPQQQMGTGLVTDKTTSDFPNQVQQLQSALSASSQAPPDGEADKNQRYQSTLQFAASLLLQIQQQQQQANAQPVQGSNNQQ